MNIFTKAKNSIFGVTQPRNVHSLENLKYLHGILQRNTTVSDANRDLLVETLRSISEILIWGDQNDSSVFDFFLEHGMLIYFLNYMRQKYGRYICVQILQTLNILFENIRDETSLYYLLSNNHVNNIILHKFDFSDEEITAYYISFLKTLSLKLNKHSINFFYNERTNDFPLYVEAIKFFNHPETMVRIAVRTLTLNVYRVPDPVMHRFILDCTATEYFSNLVWFIRNQILDFDSFIRNNRDINNRVQLTSSLEEYIDHIHYLQDIFLLNVDSLNIVLKDQLMNRLLIPVYIFSLIKREKFSRVKDPRVMLEQLTTLFLLAEIFLVITYRPIVEELADLILSADIETVETIQHRFGEEISFSQPPTALEICLAKNDPFEESDDSEISLKVIDINDEDERRRYEGEQLRLHSIIRYKPSQTSTQPISLYTSNWTDDEKSRRIQHPLRLDNQQLNHRPYFNALIQAIDCKDNDQLCFYALSVLLTMTMNPSIDSVIIESVSLTVKSSDKSFYNTLLVDKLCDILQLSIGPDSNIRIVTLNFAINLLKKLVFNEETQICYLSNEHMSRIEQVRQQSIDDLRRYYPNQELLLDMFEDEYRQIQLNPIKIEYLLKDVCMLFPPTTTPLSGVEFIKRLPSGDMERARRSIRVFFLIRSIYHELNLIHETQLPLIRPEKLLKINDKIDLNNGDLIACTIHMKERKDRRFLVVDQMQFILTEPDTKTSGWGIVKFCDFIQDVDVANDKEDSRSLHITIHKSVTNIYLQSSPPILSAKFTFDDHICCMAAKQNLMKGRQRARQMKLGKIAALLNIVTTPSQTHHRRKLRSTTVYSANQAGFSIPALPNHPGRATLISGPKKTTESIPISTASSPVSNNIEHIRSYSLSRTQSDQPSLTTNDLVSVRRTSASSLNEKTRRSNSQMIRTPKSLREWPEKPVNLLEQPSLLENVNVQILSPNRESLSTAAAATVTAFFPLNDNQSKSESDDIN